MTWQKVIEDEDVWVYEYEVIGYSQVNAFAVLLDERKIAVISPPVGISEEDFAEIEDKGHVNTIRLTTKQLREQGQR